MERREERAAGLEMVTWSARRATSRAERHRERERALRSAARLALCALRSALCALRVSHSADLLECALPLRLRLRGERRALEIHTETDKQLKFLKTI